MWKKYSPFLFGQFGYGVFANMLPIMAVLLFGLSAFHIGILNMLVSVFSMLGFLIWGRKIDHTTRRRIFGVIGFAGTAIAVLITIFSTDFTVLSIACVLIGFFFSIFGVLGSTLVAQDKSGTYFQRLRIYNALVSGGTVLGLAGGVLCLYMCQESANLRIVFLLPFTAMLLGLQLCLMFIPENAVHMPKLSKIELIRINTGVIERVHYLPSKIRHGLSGASIDRRIYGMCLGFGFMLFAFSAFYTTLPYYLLTYGVLPYQIFLVHLSSACACTVAYLLSRKARAENAVKSAVEMRSILIMIFILVPLAGIPSLVFGMAMVLNALMGVAWAGISAGSVRMVVKFADEYRMGSAMSIYHISLATGSAMGAVMGGYLYALAGCIAYIPLALSALCGLGIAVMWYEREQ
jgi:MFS family permease